MTSRIDILKLYKSLISESKKIPAYNFRNYALRKIRDTFKENKTLTGTATIDKLVEEGYKNLEIIKRQSIIGTMYSTEKLIIEDK